MEEKNEYVVDLFQKELDKRNEQQKKKIDKYKKQEEKKRKKELKRLEKEEDKGFARQQKLSRTIKYSKNSNENKFNLSLIYKIFIITILFITLTYFIYSLITNNMGIFKSILFTLMILSFILSSTIQKKKERKISFIVASSLAILWMLVNL